VVWRLVIYFAAAVFDWVLPNTGSGKKNANSGSSRVDCFFYAFAVWVFYALVFNRPLYGLDDPADTLVRIPCFLLLLYLLSGIPATLFLD
jgi:hypothetical protein